MSNAQVMVLGTFHFRESKGVVQSKEAEKQLEKIIEEVSKFKPNKLCIEIRPCEEEKYNRLFQRYTNNEVKDIKKELEAADIKGADYQIIDPIDERILFTYNLAKACNISYVNGIDYFDGWSQPEVFKKAEENKEESKRLNDLFDIVVDKYNECMSEDKSIVEIYKILNSKDFNEMQHRYNFLAFNDVDPGDDSVGIKFVADWYRRNLHILANLSKLSEENDRILVLYGAGHLKLLRDLINESYNLEYVEALQYLR